MGKSVKICGLCNKNESVDSHLIPKATYRIVVTKSKSNNPVLIKGNKIVKTSDQVRSHFLCNTCEGRLNKYGENHVFRYTYKKTGNFKLQEILKKLSPESEIDNALVYSGNKIPNIKIDHFVHFAAGIFWKASAGKWYFLREPLKNNQLGNKYEEQLGKFLKGDSLFPDNMVLTMSVSNENEPFQSVIFPVHEKQNGIFQHRFYIPGIEFILRVGNLIPKSIKEKSISHTSGGAFFFEHLDNSPLIREAKEYSRIKMEKLKKINKGV
ncbi:MAG: hypothetical protein JRG81_13650 [Deltaproteobacteria bacterium]|nr:hypothetical protein [Deltaproteobacteria bacterium]